jgi:hypothetical protein
VFADATLQRLLASGRIADETVTPDTLRRCSGPAASAARCASRPGFLLHYGVLRAGRAPGRQHPGAGAHRCSADLRDPAPFDTVASTCWARGCSTASS